MLVEMKLTTWKQLKMSWLVLDRIDLGFHIGSKRREGVEGLGARPLAFRVLDGAVADVLGGGVSEDIARGGGRGDVAHTAADDHGELGLEIDAVGGKGNLDLGAIRDERGGRLQPEQRLLRQGLVRLTRVVGVIEPDADHLGGVDRRQGSQALERSGLLVEGGRAKDIPMQTKQFAIHHLGMEYLVAFLKSPYCCHRSAEVVTKGCP